MDQNWLIDTDRGDGGIVANSLDSDMPEYTRGTKFGMTFKFWDDPSLADDHLTRYRAARDYLDYAGQVTTQQAMNGTVHVQESIPSGADVPSIILALEPATPRDWPYTDGIWAAIVGGQDPTERAADVATVEYEVTVLAEAADYASRTDLKNALAGAVV